MWPSHISKLNGALPGYTKILFHSLLHILQCLYIEKFEYTFAAKIEILVFRLHEDHIIFALTGEKGVEISACFAALGANFDNHCVM